MAHIWLYSIISVIIISLLSLIGIFTFLIKQKLLNKIILYLVSFSAGALFGDTFIHLLPELVNTYSFGTKISLFILSGIILTFIIEKFVKWRHCHLHYHQDHKIHSFAIINLIGDTVHNFIDGLIIGASYLVSIPVGIATTLAVIFHEIPQEIGDFAILIHGGYSKKKALFLNFITALTAIIGVVLALVFGTITENLTPFLISIAAGSFIYIAGSDLIPEVHKEVQGKKSIILLTAFLFGIFIMYLLTFI